jgi:hypothetical protein
MLFFIVQGLCLFLANCDNYCWQLEQTVKAKFSLWWISCKKVSWQIWNHWAKIFVYLWLIWQLSPLKISTPIPPCGNQPKMLSKFMASYQIMPLGYETFWWWHILTRVHHRRKLENYGTNCMCVCVWRILNARVLDSDTCVDHLSLSLSLSLDSQGKLDLGYGAGMGNCSRHTCFSNRQW